MNTHVIVAAVGGTDGTLFDIGPEPFGVGPGEMVIETRRALSDQLVEISFYLLPAKLGPALPLWQSVQSVYLR
jgi:hypothetical protein